MAGWSLLAAHGAQAAGDCTVAVSEVAIDAEEQAMLNGINAYRLQNGLVALTFSPTLNRAAAWQSHDMAVKRYFAHNDSLGRTFDVRLADCGYGFNTYKGENIAAGYADAANTLNQWKNSAGHNQALLTSAYRTAGIARYYDAAAPYRWYWTLDLGGYIDGGTVIAPTTAPIVPTATEIPAVTTTAPAMPTSVRFGISTASSLQVLWTDGATNETSFKLAYMATTGSAWTYLDLGENSTSFTLNGLSANTIYYAYVQACNAVGCSAWAGPATGQTAASAPPMATSVPPTATRVPPPATNVPTMPVVQPSPTTQTAPSTSTGGRVPPTPIVR